MGHGDVGSRGDLGLRVKREGRGTYGNRETQGGSVGEEGLKKKWVQREMETHSRILAWRIPGMEEPGWLLSMGSHRVGHD